MRDRESIRLAECHSSNTCSSRGWARAKSGSCGTQSRSLMWATGTELPELSQMLLRVYRNTKLKSGAGASDQTVTHSMRVVGYSTAF